MAKANNDTDQLNRAERLKIPEWKKEFRQRLEEFGEESTLSGALDQRDPITGLNEQEFIDLRLKTFRDQMPKTPKGRYKDPVRVAIIYRQKFVEYAKELCPEVLEELRPLVKSFNNLFAGGDRDKYQQLIWHLQEDLFAPADGLRNSVFQGPTPEFNYQYYWGEYRWLLYALAGKTPTKVVDSSPEFFDLRKIQKTDIDSLSTARLKIEAAFTYCAQPKIDVVSVFTDLQVALNKWVERHRVPRDWMIEYGYYFLWQFSNNPALAISDLEVNPLDSRSLEGPRFIFQAPGWRAGEQHRKDYERMLRKLFDDEIRNYFDRAVRTLALDELKQAKKPIKFENVKWLVQWTVMGWDEKAILQEIDLERWPDENKPANGVDTTILNKAFAVFRGYGLPVRD